MNHINKKHVLITGANGLLGRHALAVFKNDYIVHALVRNTPNNPIEGVQYHVVNLAQPLGIDTLPQDIDTIFHLAQSSFFRDFPDNALDIFQVNIASTASLLDFARKTKVKRFVYASSGGVYGAGAHAFHENSLINPHGSLGYYLGSKLCAEILAETYSQIMTIGILRFFFIYGSGQNRTMLVPRLIDNVKSGKPITIQGDNGIQLNPIHVSDAAMALKKMMGIDDSMIFNIGGDHTFSIREMANIIGKATDKVPIFSQADGEPRNLVADISTMKSHLLRPTTPFAQGIKDLL